MRENGNREVGSEVMMVEKKREKEWVGGEEKVVDRVYNEEKGIGRKK